MAEFYVTNSLNYEKAVKFNISLRHFVTTEGRGEHRWVLEVGTTYPDVNGDPISAKKVLLINAEDFDEVLESAVADLCAQIDWSPLVNDTKSPHITEALPTSSGVKIGASVFVSIADDLPSSGIDLSGIKITLNNSVTDFDITAEVQITGDPYEYKLRWDPPMRVYSRYD